MERLRQAVRLGGKTSVGLDIDRGAIKAVEVSSTGGQNTLWHLGYYPLPPGTLVCGADADVGLRAWA